MLLTRLFKFIIFALCSAFVFTSVTVVGAYAVFPCKYKTQVYAICAKTNIPPELVFAIIKTESSFNEEKISSKGAVGLMQIMPDTANYVSDLYFGGKNFDLFYPDDNILIGVTYLIYLFDKFEDKKTALSAYNAGEGNVNAWLSDDKYSTDGKSLNYIPFKETEEYCKKVLKRTQIYKILYRL
ncbi:MAG: lytic transglycosylase domain-containing protein [Clostridia bacterium]|nr:lytic transglycosylase domain-containing protein [Clostridia bacterium]